MPMKHILFINFMKDKKATVGAVSQEITALAFQVQFIKGKKTKRKTIVAISADSFDRIQLSFADSSISFVR